MQWCICRENPARRAVNRPWETGRPVVRCSICRIDGRARRTFPRVIDGSLVGERQCDANLPSWLERSSWATMDGYQQEMSACLHGYALVIASPPRKSARHMRWNVRFGSLADITARSRHVRFTPDSGRSAAHPSQHLAVGLSVHALARKMRNDLVRSFRERGA
jgi:hypothetical protein